jgi:hypothetical protein
VFVSQCAVRVERRRKKLLHKGIRGPAIYSTILFHMSRLFVAVISLQNLRKIIIITLVWFSFVLNKFLMTASCAETRSSFVLVLNCILLSAFVS